MARRLVVTILFAAFGLMKVLAQESSPAPQPAQKPAAERAARATFKLDFAIHEAESGKRINSRDYSLLVEEGGRSSNIRMTMRLPVLIGGETGATQYMDVGLSLDASVWERGQQAAVDATMELTNLAVDEKPPGDEKSIMLASRNPIVNRISTRVGGALVTLGKPTMLATMDDPRSKRQFQLEVTATRLKP